MTKDRIVLVSSVGRAVSSAAEMKDVKVVDNMSQFLSSTPITRQVSLYPEPRINCKKGHVYLRQEPNKEKPWLVIHKCRCGKQL